MWTNLFYLILSHSPPGFHYQLDLTDTNYHFKLTFQHNTQLPIPSDASDCNPQQPKLAPDGLPYLVSREHLVLFPHHIQKVLGMYGFSVDWMGCGHPPLGVYTIPHYDLHFYYISESQRDKIGCPEAPPAPVCKSNPEFFLPLTNNLPPGFKPDLVSAVPRQGLHWYDPNESPSNSQEWNLPQLIVGSYTGQLTFWEPMVPLAFRGNSIITEQPILYQNQTETRLPRFYKMEWKMNETIKIILLGNTTQTYRCCRIGGYETSQGGCRLEYHQDYTCSDWPTWKWILIVLFGFLILLGLGVLLCQWLNRR